jgi:hypothetical protein
MPDPGHDGFACARVICKQVAQWLFTQHRFVNSDNLVWLRLDQRGVYGYQWVEEVSQVDALSLGGQAKGSAVCIEAPC